MLPSLVNATAATITAIFLDINPVEQCVQGRFVDLDVRRIAIADFGHAKSARIEPLIEEAEAGSIEEQDPHRVPTLSEENEQRAAARFVTELVSSHPREPIESAS